MEELMRDSVVCRRLDDALTISGIGEGRRSPEISAVRAFRKLNMVDISKLQSLLRAGKRGSNGRLTVIISEKNELLRHILSFRGCSGFLLQYLAACELDVEVV